MRSPRTAPGLKRALLSVARRATSALLAAGDVHVVVGMRRSGNHAFIQWYAGALAGRAVTFGRHGHHHHLETDPGAPAVVLLNEVNKLRPRDWYALLLRHRRALRGRSVIITFEDVDTAYARWSFQSPHRVDARFVVRRSTLNLVASRLTALRRAAADGRADTNFAVDRAFVPRLASLASAPADTWTTWRFDDWLTDRSYRTSFLDAAGLTVDTAPEVSHHAGGSSFTGEASVDDLVNRWQDVDLPPALVDSLLATPGVLSESEVAALRNVGE